MEPKVSVIIITTGDRPEIKRAINSVRAQTYTDYELIIFTDKNRRGSAYARNQGFLESKGQYIVFLDDDNEFLPTFLEETVYLLENSSEECGGVRVGRLVKMPGFETYAPPITHTGFDSIDWGFLMKREVMEKIKYDETLFADEDADFGIEFAKRYQTIPIDKPLEIAHAEIDEGSVCEPTPKRLQGLENFIKKHKKDYANNRNERRYLYRLAGRNFYRGGFPYKGLVYFIKSFLAAPSWKTGSHLWHILWGWENYNRFMDREERKLAI